MELLWRLVRLVGLALLHVLCTVRNAWLWVEYSFRDSGMIFSRSSVASIKAGRRGTKPSAPTVLGVVIFNQPILVQQDQMQATECKLLDLFDWAQTNGFRLILLYDASGKLCDTCWVERLHEKLVMTGRSKKVLWVGWAVPSDWWMEYTCNTASNSSGALPLGISLLSPSDGEWPLNAASRAAAKKNASDDNTKDGFDDEVFHSESPGPALSRALNAPDTLKTQLAAVSGPLVTVEPQVIFVFGDFPTMAGFPSWTIRNAEFFQVGRLLYSDTSKFDAILRRYMKVRQRFGK